jgi:transcriptional regulator GlxA family with amidase domain
MVKAQGVRAGKAIAGRALRVNRAGADRSNRPRVMPGAPQDPELIRRLLRAKDRMDAASHQEWPVARLARVSGVSAAHFARSFKQAFGVPPHRYLLTRRIERAATLLRDTEWSVTEIAFCTGWGSLGTFGRTFREIAGDSPGAVRAAQRAGGYELSRVPACVLSAASRPHLTIAVSEKRRRLAGDITPPKQRRSV